MDEVLLFIALACGMLGWLWYLDRGQLVGSLVASREGQLWGTNASSIDIRRLASRKGVRVRLNFGVALGRRGVTLSAEDAVKCAITLDEGGARRCGPVEITPDYDGGDGSMMRIGILTGVNDTLVKHWWRPVPDPRHGARLLMTRSQARVVAGLLRRAAESPKEKGRAKRPLKIGSPPSRG